MKLRVAYPALLALFALLLALPSALASSASARTPVLLSARGTAVGALGLRGESPASAAVSLPIGTPTSADAVTARIEAYPTYDDFVAMSFASNATLSFTIRQSPGGTILASGSKSGDQWGFASFYGLSVDLSVGMEITVSDGSVTKHLTLAPVAVTSVDPPSNVIAGTAPAGAEVLVEPIFGFSTSRGRTVTAGSDGAWSVDFSPDDVDYATYVRASVVDDDGDTTTVVRPPTIIEAYVVSNEFHADGLAPNSTVSFAIRQAPGGSVLATGSRLSDANGSVYFWPYDHNIDLVAGMEITVRDGTTSKALTLPALAVTSIDPASDVVAGIAPAGARLRVMVAANYYGWITYATADGDGHWSAGFTGLDVTPLMHAEAAVGDADGDTTYVVRKADQTITFDPLPAKTYGDPDFGISASASSGLAVSFSATGHCTVAGSTFHLTGAGSCVITASQAGNQDIDAASASQTLTIAKAGQAITFDALAGKTYGDANFTLAANASSGLTVSFAASGNCTLTGLTVHISGAGTCTITASQAGSENYDAAVDVPQTFTVAKASQTIMFGPLPAKTYGDPDFEISASSGLAVSFSATGHCTVAGSTFHLTGAGSCIITASQAGNENYAAASASRTLTIAKAGQTITFGAPAGKTYGDADFMLNASASSGLAVSFAASGSCTVSGFTVHITAAGTCALTASQPGDENVDAATSVQQTFTIVEPNRVPTVVCRVPKVVGKTLAAAKTTIKQNHCGAGTIKYAYSSKMTRGKVVSQSRTAGRVLALNTKINLVVSRGVKSKRR